ncbi:transketolase [Treponema lecithinolyticum]|uniref:transketolase n=1 Tax=Treponema lecithinolyticum TaxID=53418 RepID=UPI0028F13D9D|nr:transketolase [Treponema lecithinolyticum]
MNIQALKATALSVRSLSMDAIQKANSGHPGLPLGCAELAAVLYGEIMKYNPADSHWANRDRFVLSAGHGSMLLYSILHLAGYKVSLKDIKSFRQIDSRCAGHPEYGVTDGVETTTGPLGQGIATAVGMALAETVLAARFNTKKHTIVDHYTYTLVGEGCLMEGVASEASSFAGAMKLGKLIAFYDKNKITIDGATDMVFAEDVAKRYESYGWQVLNGSMYDMEKIALLVEKAKADERPSLIILESIIGKGAPTVAGTAKAHGAPLGADGIAAAKKELGLPLDKEFYVVPEAYEYFEKLRAEAAKREANWKVIFAAWAEENPALAKEWKHFYSGKPSKKPVMTSYKTGDSLATRNASGNALFDLSKVYKNLIGGSADLQGPNVTKLADTADYSPACRSGRYIHFGIREFAMAAVCNGLSLHGGFKPFCATFLVFADYLRPALRLAALMKQPVIYVLTHDSIFVGEDGPTHQPVETLSSLRIIPNVRVLRPGDAEETAAAWESALLSKETPVCIALSRQALTVYPKDDADWRTSLSHGAYIVQKGGAKPDVTVLASGSEVSLALEAAKQVKGKKVRIVSVMDRELFRSQPDTVKQAVMGKGVRTVVAEAASPMGWESFVANEKDLFCLTDFGASAPAKKVAEHFGFTSSALAKLIGSK